MQYRQKTVIGTIDVFQKNLPPMTHGNFGANGRGAGTPASCKVVQLLVAASMKRTCEVIMTIVILLAVIAALSIQIALTASSEKKQNDSSLQQVLAKWIQAQDAFSHWTQSNKVTPSQKQQVDDISLQLNIIQWIRDNGGYFNPKQEIRRAIPGNDSSPFGIFANETIQQGELLVNVPWKCILTAGTDEWDTYVHCHTTRFIIDEMHKVLNHHKETSFFEPYIQYLLSAPPVHIPSTWSNEGKRVFRGIIGKKRLPPKRATSWTKYWRDECHASDDDAFETQVAMQLVSRGDDDTLTPVYDMYNHRNGKWLNTDAKMVQDERHEMHASKTIPAGEQIYLSYNQCRGCFNRHYNFGTAEMFRDYGFVEQYPQRWIFEREEIALDIDENENGTLKLTWLDATVHKKFGKLYEVSEWGIGVLKSHLQRLKELYESDLKAIEEGTSSITLSRKEVDSILSYYYALTTALDMAVKEAPGYLALNEE